MMKMKMVNVVSVVCTALLIATLTSCTPPSTSDGVSDNIKGSTSGGSDDTGGKTYLTTVVPSVTGGDGLEITDYRGDATEIIIPATLGGRAVVSIADNAFADKGLVAITLPATLTHIGDKAFASNALTTVSIKGQTPPTLGAKALQANTLYVPNNSVTAYQNESRWRASFAVITTVLTRTVITVVEVSDGVEIDSYRGTDTDIVIPPSIDGKTVVGIAHKRLFQGVFEDKGLTSVVIADTITYIGESALRDNQLTSIHFPDTLISLGDYAFYGNALTSVNFNEALSSIGKYAFAANALTSVEYPNISALSKAIFYGNNITSLSFAKGVTRIADYSFSNNALIAVDIVPDITHIGIKAFRDNKLTTLSLSSDILEIQRGAFRDNPLESVTINTVTPPKTYIFDSNPTFEGPIDKLYVPAVGLTHYQSTLYWTRPFTNISAIP